MYLQCSPPVNFKIKIRIGIKSLRRAGLKDLQTAQNILEELTEEIFRRFKFPGKLCSV